MLLPSVFKSLYARAWLIIPRVGWRAHIVNRHRSIQSRVPYREILGCEFIFEHTSNPRQRKSKEDYHHIWSEEILGPSNSGAVYVEVFWLTDWTGQSDRLTSTRPTHTYCDQKGKGLVLIVCGLSDGWPENTFSADAILRCRRVITRRVDQIVLVGKQNASNIKLSHMKWCDISLPHALDQPRVISSGQNNSLALLPGHTEGTEYIGTYSTMLIGKPAFFFSLNSLRILG